MTEARWATEHMTLRIRKGQGLQGPDQNAMSGHLRISARMLNSDVILMSLLGTMAVTHTSLSVAVPCHQSVLTSGDTYHAVDNSVPGHREKGWWIFVILD